MSTPKVELFPEARVELLEAIDWYRDRNRKAANRFEKEVQELLNRISRNVRAFPRTSEKIRTAVLKSFPHYLVVYDICDPIQIVAVAHTSRQPGYWSDRL